MGGGGAVIRPRGWGVVGIGKRGVIMGLGVVLVGTESRGLVVPLLVAPLLATAGNVEIGLGLGGVEDGEDEAVEMGISGREIAIGALVVRVLVYCVFLVVGVEK
jgi:hypothetical protein